MKHFSILTLVVLSVFSSTTYADWKFDTIEGMQVHYYLPKVSSPLSIKSSTKKALMINLHGCAQKAEDIKKDGNWENTADDFNMIVALPKVPNGGVISGCWDYYGADHTTTNRHNGPVIKLVMALLAKPELDIDPAQVYVSGLSSGGGETMVLGCLVPEMFAGLGINAGPSTGTTSQEISFPKTTVQASLDTCKKLATGKTEFFKTQLTSIIYGNNDYIVNTAFDTNNAEIMRSIYDAQNKSTFDTTKLAGSATAGTGTMWSDAKGARVSLIMNTGLGHNWPAGQGGNGGTFVNKKSINYPDYLARFFFTNNRRTKTVVLPEVMFDSIDSKVSKFIISGLITIPQSIIKTISVVVTKKSTGETVDKFEASIDHSNHFIGISKALKDGEYNFDFEVKNALGLSRIFKRNSWLGEVAGVNAPQVINTHFQSALGCLITSGQAVNNGEAKVTSVNIIIDGTQNFIAPVENTLWSFKTCNLADGEHTADVYAENETGLRSNSQQFTFISSLESATATLQEHMEAKRLNWEDYGVWYMKYGHHAFTLYLGADQVWREKSL
ncbi:MAG: PHB depolymerase family esterase [Rhizobacter sp.]|nr:PHB depolymerase family esterase [Bacteriovorax sp.]